VLFDDTLHRCLDSYLKLAPRAYDHAIRLPDSARSMLKSVHRLVFMTFLRMSTHKESKDCYITPSAYGEMIYDNFIFDIPKLFDLCILYGGGNNAILSKMISNIFSQQPRYNDDLNDIVPMIIQIFENIKEKCGLGDISDEPQILSADNVKSVFTLSSDDFRDIIFYLSDIGMTLLAFLEIYPEASCIFHQHTFVSRLSACYETLVPELEKSLKQRKSDHPR
ncbi:activating signal cointegrator 1 complex subunit 2-like, partial [Saccoglossus kowalevskii]